MLPSPLPRPSPLAGTIQLDSIRRCRNPHLLPLASGFPGTGFGHLSVNDSNCIAGRFCPRKLLENRKLRINELNRSGLGRGRIIRLCLEKPAFTLAPNAAKWSALSPGERAGVRGKGLHSSLMHSLDFGVHGKIDRKSTRLK